MIRYTIKIIFALMLLILGEFAATYAQMDSDTILRVKIPNEFVVRDKTYPAGDYIIKPVDNDLKFQYILELIGPGSSPAIFETNGTSVNEAPRNTELVFEKVGEQYFLSQIFAKGDANGNEIERSRKEKELIAAGQLTEVYVVNEVLPITRKRKVS